jgi:hypothetical protein
MATIEVTRATKNVAVGQVHAIQDKSIMTFSWPQTRPMAKPLAI